MLLSDHFFTHLRAFGVESVSFDIHAEKKNGTIDTMSFSVYQEEEYAAGGDDENVKHLPVYEYGQTEDLTGGRYGAQVTAARITLYIADITPGGGVMIEIATSASSNVGIYHFGHVEFHFPTTNTEA